MPSAVRRTSAVLVVATLTTVGTLLLAACAGPGPDTAGPRPVAAPTAGVLGTGFVDAEQPPAPESTISPAPHSWDAVHPPRGYDVVLLSDAGDDTAATRTLTAAVRAWATAERVHVTPVAAATPDDRLDAVDRAVRARPDLVVSVGDPMVDPVAAVSPSALAQQFLVLGAEIAEPTANVTAADWTGAGFRGEGLGASSHHDPDSFTDERAGRALRAGIAAVLHDLRGIVVWVD